jgi:GntR family transcriptional repressor for pyruvate dehydrogenase complex
LQIKKLQRKKIWEQVSDQIKALIIRGDWQVGYKLPSEIELAAQFGVSRPTLREALRHLNLLGLIDIRHGEGNFVSYPEVESFMLPLLPLLIKNKDDILSIMEARNMVEVAIAGLAANRADDEEIDSLEQLLQQMVEFNPNNEQDKEQFAKTDYLFHKQIALATRNPIIIKMYQAIEDLLLGQQLRIIGFPNAMVNGIAEHQKIFDAIKKKDVQEAGIAMSSHMKNTLKRILSSDNLIKEKELHAE